MHDTGASAVEPVFSFVWGAAHAYPALTLFLTGAGGAVAGSHYLGVAAKAGATGAVGNVIVGGLGLYAGLRAGTGVAVLRDYFGNCNP